MKTLLKTVAVLLALVSCAAYINANYGETSASIATDAPVHEACRTRDCRERDAQERLRKAFVRDLSNPKTRAMAKALMKRCADSIPDVGPIELLACYGG